MLDDDLYKLTVQQAILELYPEAKVEYRFINRSLKTHKFNKEFLKEMKNQINLMAQLKLTQDEYMKLKNSISFFKPQYLEYLKNYRYDPKEVSVSLDRNSDLKISIKGFWHSTTLWEVKLMALISELYFKIIDKNWNDKNVFEEAKEKGKRLSLNSCTYADFGTRRRRSRKIHKKVLEGLILGGGDNSTLCGTSNIKLALDMGIKPIGTISHEFMMGLSVLEGLRKANHHSMTQWNLVYGAELGIFLPDTYGLKSFIKDFNKHFSMLFQGTRWDSGDWKRYTDKMISHYKSLDIDALSKTIVYSDSLNINKAILINDYCRGRIKASFGIGTFFSNNGFKDSPALNMVIKMHKCEGVPVVKLSDDPSKSIGDQEAVRIAKWTFLNQSLDS